MAVGLNREVGVEVLVELQEVYFQVVVHGLLLPQPLLVVLPGFLAVGELLDPTLLVDEEVREEERPRVFVLSQLLEEELVVPLVEGLPSHGRLPVVLKEVVLA